jgi:hypothetical protein
MGHAECLVFGRIAGDNAAREPDRTADEAGRDVAMQPA